MPTTNGDPPEVRGVVLSVQVIPSEETATDPVVSEPTTKTPSPKAMHLGPLNVEKEKGEDLCVQVTPFGEVMIVLE
jgi:hypothetical protein